VPPRKTLALDRAGGKAFPVGWLVGTNGRCRDWTFKLDGERVLIGCGAECGVRLDDDSISTRHCEVRRDEGRFRLSDLGATNGVFVNGKRSREHELIDNDLVTLGRVELRFKCVE
jgi:pSer/pThr/pTyr-binding forkhead associated (FHA) protein